jgi:hypothetical protein
MVVKGLKELYYRGGLLLIKTYRKSFKKGGKMRVKIKIYSKVTQN